MQGDGDKLKTRSSKPAPGALNDNEVSAAKIDVIDNPCWGSPTRCSLSDLLALLDRRTSILFESNDYIVLNKPPDLRMDGNYPSTVHKLLTYWYPPDSILNKTDAPDDRLLLLDRISKLIKHNDLRDNQLRPCHQLDYATSGALLVGRNRKAAGRACEAFRERTTQKAYLAIVHSHVLNLHNNYETLSLSLQKDIYGRIRAFDKEVADRRKAKRKTFNGFQPLSSIFMKWKQFESRGGRGKRPRDADMMQRVDDRILDDDRAKMSAMSWGEVKQNAKWKQTFEDVAKLYNESLKEEQIGGDGEKERKSKKALELPRVFRLEEDADPNVFYVNVSLAQHPSDFAMAIHPSATKTNNDKDVIPDHHLDFKLAITRCTILQRSHLNGSTPVTKIRLQPLTGRRHQLRCHMKVVGAPIVGDATYEGADEQQNLVERMCLHAFQLQIEGVVDTAAPDPFVVTDDSVDVRMI